MDPRKQNDVTQTAFHVPQGEGKSVWILDELLTFKVHAQSETVGRTTVHAFTNTATEKGKILFIETPAGPLEQFLEEAGEPVSDPSSPPQGPPDMDKLQASAQRTGGIEFVVPSEEEEAGP